jgi:hypothetical protein
MAHCEARFITISALIFVAVGSAGTEARAQAWVGEKGSLDLSLDYNLAVSSKIIESDGGPDIPDAGVTSHTFMMGAEYVPLPKLAVNVAVPLTMLKFTGNAAIFTHPAGGSYDDGTTHTTLTDLRVGTRYQVLEELVAMSPHVAVSVPLADYETIGNAVGGRGLKALHLGLSVGRLLTDQVYVHALYEFSFIEKYDRTVETATHSQNRSDAQFTLGYKPGVLQDRLDVHVDANARFGHGGIRFIDYQMLSMNEQLYHDAILDEDILLIGGGLGYQISNSLSVSLAARFFVRGENTQNASVFGVGVGWSPL